MNLTHYLKEMLSQTWTLSFAFPHSFKKDEGLLRLSGNRTPHPAPPGSLFSKATDWRITIYH